MFHRQTARRLNNEQRNKARETKNRNYENFLRKLSPSQYNRPVTSRVNRGHHSISHLRSNYNQYLLVLTVGAVILRLVFYSGLCSPIEFHFHLFN